MNELVQAAGLKVAQQPWRAFLAQVSEEPPLQCRAGVRAVVLVRAVVFDTKGGQARDQIVWHTCAGNHPSDLFGRLSGYSRISGEYRCVQDVVPSGTRRPLTNRPAARV